MASNGKNTEAAELAALYVAGALSDQEAVEFEQRLEAGADSVETSPGLTWFQWVEKTLTLEGALGARPDQPQREDDQDRVQDELEALLVDPRQHLPPRDGP